MENQPYLSVIIPAYNEAEKIVDHLKKIDTYLREKSFSYEILVVTDGPKDNTAEVVEHMKLDIPNLRLIDRKENMGKGYTVKQGILEAKGKIRLFTDADGSTDISHFDKMRPLFDQGYDVVGGSRYGDLVLAHFDPPTVQTR